MIKELIQFTNSLDDELKAIGVIPKEGLHVMLSLVEKNEELKISNIPTYEVFSKKSVSDTSFLKKCAALAQLSWMVNTNKCFDLPAKGIHSCSPFCLAFKRESIYGGGKFNEAKIKLYDRVESYFNKTNELLEEGADKEKAKIFQQTLNSREKIHLLLNQIPEFPSLKDTAYVVFYLDISLDTYKMANNNYLGGKLFNTEEYNVNGVDGNVYGTSNFFNGFNSKKLYLLHQSATFNITGRISAQDAKSLFEFENIASRRILPNPLPIFIYENERKESISIFKRDALEGGSKIGYREIIEELQKKTKKEVGNYYLLFYQFGEIKDFDFVSKFEYALKNEDNNSWLVEDFFECNLAVSLSNVFDFERTILPIILNNALIVKTKVESILFKYFDDIDPAYCKTANTFILILKYRKTLYDFVYKSDRKGFTQRSFEDILITGLLDDIRLDKYENKYHSEDRNIRQKLNVLFSLYHNFQPFKKDTRFMPTQIIELRKNVEALATNGEVNIVSDFQFAFVVGQVIYYILSKSKSADKSYARLEPFLQLSEAERLKQALLKIFDTYKHERFSRRFSNPFAQVMAYIPSENMKKLMPIMLAGFFSDNQLFGKEKENDTSNEND